MKSTDFAKIAFALVFIAALIIRLYDVGSPLLHHDEGVNGHFMLMLMRGHGYHYDPYEYHGPSLYFLSVIPFALFGASAFSLRLMPALFGAGLILLLWPLRRRFGSAFVLGAASFIAVSPTLVYYSRYAIHEMLFVFFTMAMSVCFLLFVGEKDKARRSRLAYAFSASLALLVATKESSYLVLFIILSYAAILLWLARRKGKKARLGLTTKEIINCAIIFVWIFALLFSSFFTDADGMRRGAISTFTYLTKGSLSLMHAKPPLYYLQLILAYESPLLLLGALGAVGIVWARNRKAVFLACWFLAMLAAYSLTPYKTPWLVINMTLPMTLLAGYFVSLMAGKRQLPFMNLGNVRFRRLSIALLTVIICAYLLYTAIEISMLHFNEDENNMLAYAHTNSETTGLLSLISEKAGESNNSIQLDSYGMWPLPWYFELANYNIGRDPSLWGNITEAYGCGGCGPDCMDVIGSRLKELGYPIVIGPRSDFECISPQCYSRRDFQLRNNYWLSLFYSECK